MLAPSYQDILNGFQEATNDGCEPNLIAVFINKNKTKAIRRKIGRYLKQELTSKGRVCPILIGKPPYMGFYKV